MIGPDAVGLLSHTVRYLAKTETSIISLESKVIPGAQVGFDMFNCDIEALVPRVISREDFDAGFFT